MNFLYNGQVMTAIAFCLMINQSTNLTDKCRSTWSQKYLDHSWRLTVLRKMDGIVISEVKVNTPCRGNNSKKTVQNVPFLGKSATC